MPVSVEAGQEQNFIRNLLERTQSQVWSRFPEPLQPDLGVLLPRLKTSGIVRQQLTIYPQLPEAYRVLSAQSITESERIADMTQLVYYDPSTRAISISPNIFRLPENTIKEHVAYAVGHDLSTRQMIKPPFAWTPIERDLVSRAMDNDMVRNTGLRPEDVEIVKTGFRKRLVTGNYAITELNPEVLNLRVDEVFATMYAFVTRLIAERGSIEKFENDLEKGKIKVRPREDHPAFFAAFLRYAGKMNWRQLLLAFQDGETGITREYLAFSLGRQGDQALDDLVMAMQKDERAIEEANRRYI